MILNQGYGESWIFMRTLRDCEDFSHDRKIENDIYSNNYSSRMLSPTEFAVSPFSPALKVVSLMVSFHCMMFSLLYTLFLFGKFGGLFFLSFYANSVF